MSVPVCQYVMVVSRLTWSRDVNEDLFGCDGRPFYQGTKMGPMLRVVRGVAWARQCNVFEWCRVELPLNSASIRRPFVVHFPSKCYSGASDKMSSTVIFTFLKKRWQPKRTAEPEVQAVPPLRHPPSARKSRWHPSLRPSPAEPFCLLPDGSICPRISGFIRF